jgi:hypothetical protein
VGEQDSAKPSLAVAALLDVVRATQGPAALVLGNGIKSGSHGRGSGVIEDRLDIVFEVRDATGFKPSGTKDWVEELPPAGRDAWQERAARRRKRAAYRLAFVPTKFRIGEEPEPFAFEVSCASEPWACRDVTSELVSEGEQARQDAEAAKVKTLDDAATALADEVKARGSMLVRGEAESFLVGRGLTRNGARELVDTHNGVLWRKTGSGHRHDPKKLEPSESERDTARSAPSGGPHRERLESEPILAACTSTGRPESTSTEPAPTAARGDGGFWPSPPPPQSDQEMGCLVGRHGRVPSTDPPGRVENSTASVGNVNRDRA